MRRSTKVLLAVIINVVVAFLGLLLIERKLERNHTGDSSAMRRQVRPYYWWSLYTHDGTEIGTTDGPLKLALHPFVIHTNLPNQRAENFSVNSLGFRGAEISPVRTERRRIIVVGGSTAFGTGLDNNDETFARQLDGILDAEVINAAVIGHVSGQELVYLLTELVDLKPDLVIALDGVNDFSRVREPNKRPGSSSAFDQIEARLKTFRPLTDSRFLVRVSALHRVVFPRTVDRINRSRLAIWRQKEEPEGPPDFDLAASVYTNNILKMKKVSEGFDFNFLCVLQPDRDKGEQYRRFRETAKKHFTRAGLDYLDLNDAGYEIAAERFMDGIHLDGPGNRQIAEIVAKKIVAGALLADRLAPEDNSARPWAGRPDTPRAGRRPAAR